MDLSPHPDVPDAAVVSPVQEVTIVGSADLGFWTDRLRRDGLVPASVEGRAQVLIVSAAFAFKGIPSREVSLSVRLDTPGTGRTSYLEQAFNSVRFFAWIERVVFSTPYHHAEVAVEARPPASFSVRLRDGGGLVTTMAAGDRPPVHAGEEGWQVRVLLPRKSPTASRRLFHARLFGPTRVFRFLPEDVLEIQPSLARPVLQALVDSGFKGEEWIVRDGATHRKSRTLLESRSRA